jgi:methyl-accepting chemotaxis protein
VGYSAYELVGVEKRDLLRRRINEATDDQKEAGESFASALERLQQTYGVQGSELEKVYSRLNSAFEDAKEEVDEVKKSREQMNTVASDLFEEWKKETE